MTYYTAEMEKIKKRMSEVVLGFKGKIVSVLIPMNRADKSWYLDLATGDPVLLTEFETVIRPGDRFEGRLDAYDDWRTATYLGYRGPYRISAFAADVDGRDIEAVGQIRPLPAADTE